MKLRGASDANGLGYALYSIGSLVYQNTANHFLPGVAQKIVLFYCICHSLSVSVCLPKTILSQNTGLRSWRTMSHVYTEGLMFARKRIHSPKKILPTIMDVLSERRPPFMLERTIQCRTGLVSHFATLIVCNELQLHVAKKRPKPFGRAEAAHTP